MSFTQDELQAFNNILEQRLAVQRRELERVFELRLQILERDMEQRFTSVYQNLLRDLPMRLSDQQQKIKEVLSQQLEVQLSRQLETFQSNLGVWQQRLEELIGLRDVTPSSEIYGANDEIVDIGLEGSEVPLEITWEDLIGSLDKLMDKRFAALFTSVQQLLKDIEHNLVELLQQLREVWLLPQTTNGSVGPIMDKQEGVFANLEQLERVVESMQVIMAANHALLSNRLYYHRQLSSERAHPGKQSMNTGNQVFNAKEEKDESGTPT